MIAAIDNRHNDAWEPPQPKMPYIKTSWGARSISSWGNCSCSPYRRSKL